MYEPIEAGYVLVSDHIYNPRLIITEMRGPTVESGEATLNLGN